MIVIKIGGAAGVNLDADLRGRGGAGQPGPAHHPGPRRLG